MLLDLEPLAGDVAAFLQASEQCNHDTSRSTFPY